MIFLHIGTPKTGSKSIQSALADHAERLRALGYSLYRGTHKDGSNHVELHLATLREACETLSRLKWPWARGDAYRREVAERVARFLHERETPHAVFSNEGLAFLRHPDELQWLQAMLSVAGDAVRIILYLRNKDDFLRAYEAQIRKVPGRAPATDPRSALYLGTDAWITDYPALIDAYADCFGREALTVLDYDREVAVHGSVLPSFQRALGLPPLTIRRLDRYFLNRSV